MSIADDVKYLYNQYGQRKPMGVSASSTAIPHFFLFRTFLAENDLLVIFNTKRCRYQCDFCQLPAKSSKKWINETDILSQFMYVMEETKHALSVIDRITLSNEGSILDTATFSKDALIKIFQCIKELRRVRTIVLESRLEFVDIDVINQLKQEAPQCTISILTGFESKTPYIRDEILNKRESLTTFLSGLDRIRDTKCNLTAYVLYKPDPKMSDDDAFGEASDSIDYLHDECRKREIPLTIRLNPMYIAEGSKWAEAARCMPNYLPPKLTDVMKLAATKRGQGIPIYIGLSSEGLGGYEGTYMARDDYSPDLIKPIKLFNDYKIVNFKNVTQ